MGRRFSAALLLVALSQCAAQSGQPQQVAQLGTIRFSGAPSAAPANFIRTAKIGDGGFGLGIDISAAGAPVLSWNDTNNAYVWNSSLAQWVLLTVNTSMPSAQFGFGEDVGVWEIRSAPAIPTVAYMIYAGNLFRTANLTATVDANGLTNTRWSYLSAFTTVTAAANDHPWVEYNAKMAIDPSNTSGDVVLLGGQGSSLRYTVDAGATFATPTGAPNDANAENYVVAFDASGGTTTCSGHTVSKNVYVVENGGTTTGVYKSTTGVCGTFSATTGGPTVVRSMVNDGGTIYTTDNASQAPTTGSLWALSGGTWSHVLSASDITVVALNPGGTGPHLVVVGTSGALSICNASCTSSGNWITGIAYSAQTAVAGQPQWTNFLNSGLEPGGMAFDPNQTNVLWLASGFSYEYTTPPTTNAAFLWNVVTNGSEQLSSNSVVVAGGCPIMLVQDRALYKNCTPDSGMNVQNAIQQTYNLPAGYIADVVGSNVFASIGTDFLGGHDYSGYSTDSGTTWQPFNSWEAKIAAAKLSDGSGTTCNGAPGLAILDLTGSGQTTAGLSSWSAGSGTIVRVLAQGTSPAGFNSALGAMGFQQTENYYPITVIDINHICLQNPASWAFNSAWATNGATYTVVADTEPLTSMTGQYFIRSVQSSGGLIGVNLYVSSNLLDQYNHVRISGVTGTGGADVNGDWVLTANPNNGPAILFGSSFNAGHTYTANTGTLFGPTTSGGPIAADTTGQNIMRVPSGSNGSQNPQCSTDGGKTWTELINTGAPQYARVTNATWSSAAGGTIVFTTDVATNVKTGALFAISGVTPSGYNNGQYTATSDAVGTTLTVTGTGANPGAFSIAGIIQPDTGFGLQSFFWQMKWNAADRVTPQTIYLNSYTSGFYKVVNCAPSAPITTAYTAIANAGYGQFGTGNWQMQSVPGEAGHLFMVPGKVGSGPTAGSPSATFRLWRYCNGGGTSGSPETPVFVAGFFSPWAVSFGKAAPGESYPSIYVVGWYAADGIIGDAVLGVWRSIDDASHGSSTCTSGTWQMIPGSDFPAGNSPGYLAIAADPNSYGYWYAALAAAGFVWGHQNFLLKRDIDPASNDNSPAFLARAG